MNYFSSSSFTQFKERPIEFYIQRLGPKDLALPYEPQGLAQAMGIGFDEAVKAEIMGRDLDWSSVEIAEKDQVIADSLGLLKAYKECGALDRVLALGPVGDEVKVEGFAPGSDVPLLGYVDLVVQPDYLCAHALDWKVYGGGTPATARSPNKGYLRRYLADGPVLGKKAEHALARSYFEELSPKWAQQLSMYAWMLNPEDGARGIIRERPGAIEQVTFSRGVVTFTQYRAWISKEFQVNLRDELVAAWETVQQERVVDLDLEPEFLRLLI